MAYRLTKSKYILGLQCEKALFLNVYSPNLAWYSADTLEKFRQGRGFEKSFKDTFPAGIDVSKHMGKRFDRYAEFTAAQLSQPGEVVLFEAGFIYHDVLVLADVLHKAADGTITIYEVKNSLQVSDTFRNDVSIQHYVISHALAEIMPADLFHPQAEIAHFYVLYNDGQGGFLKEDLLEESRAKMDFVSQHVSRFLQVLDAHEPQVEMSAHCDTPYECPFKRYCMR
ncbi:MAG: hypothetical protein MJZ67_05665 [Bacteroidales bacterium]|nr:hypothetical protein [Bacteroidales bacterium]